MDRAMASDRRARLWGLVLARADGKPVTIDHVCATAVSQTAVDGASVTVTLDAGVRETLYASDWVSADLAELSLTLGEGPSVDADSGAPTLVADLTTVESHTRWPVFAPAVAIGGVRATFALPLRIGGIGLGVLDLYRARAGPLSREQMADGLMLADTVCGLLLDSAQSRWPGMDGPDHGPEPAALQHPEVHQATGMLMVQLGVSAAVALVRLRAYAYAHDRRLQDVAGDIVARRLRLPGDA
jgi:ANTAR domain